MALDGEMSGVQSPSSRHSAPLPVSALKLRVATNGSPADPAPDIATQSEPSKSISLGPPEQPHRAMAIASYP